MPLILTPDMRYRFYIRDDSPPIVADGCLIRETWIENVYQLDQNLTGKIFLDIGANIGAVSVWAAAHGAARVIAVEPEPSNIEILKQNLGMNGVSDRVEIVQCAIGPQTGEGFITAGRGNGQLVYEERDNASPCEVLSLKDLIESLLEPWDTIDVAKIDIEGSEYPVLAAVEPETLNRIRYLTLEFNGAPSLEAFGAMATKIAEYGNTHILGAPSRGGYIYSNRY